MSDGISINQALELALGIIGSMTLIIGNRISKDIHKLTESVDTLNCRMATIIERVDSHEKRINKIEEKI